MLRHLMAAAKAASAPSSSSRSLCPALLHLHSCWMTPAGAADASTQWRPAPMWTLQTCVTAAAGSSYQYSKVARQHPHQEAEAPYSSKLIEQLTSAGLTKKQSMSLLQQTASRGMVQSQPPSLLLEQVEQLLGASRDLPAELDMAQLLANHPELLQVPPATLVSQLGQLYLALQQEVGLTASQVAGYMHQDPHLPDHLGAPQECAIVLQDKFRAYQDIMGEAPRAEVFLQRSSSHINLGQVKLEGKLQQLQQLMGKGTALAALSRHPHLLSSKPDTLAALWGFLQELLGASEAEMQHLVTRAPRILQSTPEGLEARLEGLRLGLGGVSMEMIRPLLLKHPQLLTAATATLTAKLKYFSEKLGGNVKAVLRVMKQQPSLLGMSLDTIDAKMEELSRVLQLSPKEAASRVLSRTPSLLLLKPDMLQGRIPQLAEVMQVPQEEVLKAVRIFPGLLIYRPETLAVKVRELAEGMDISEEKAVSFYLGIPTAYMLQPKPLATKALKLLQLCMASASWSATPGWQGEEGKLKALYWGPRGPERMAQRMEFLLDQGWDSKERLTSLGRVTDDKWEAKYPEYRAWLESKQHSSKDV